MKILIVDDSLLDRKLLVSLLKRQGIENEILQAGDGEEGLKILSQHYQDICLILLDWQMPKIDGMGFMRSVIAVPEIANVPIVMITASGTDENKKMAHQVNPQLAGYVVKPFKPEILMEVIRPHLK